MATSRRKIDNTSDDLQSDEGAKRPRMATSKDKTDNAIDDILTRVADGLVSNSDIEKLGKELGLSIPDITRFIDTNVKGTSVTSDGTRSMLRRWAGGVESSEILPKLKSALRNVDMIRLAESIKTLDIRTNLPTMSQEELDIYREQLKRHYTDEYDTIKVSPLDSDSRMEREVIFVNLLLLHEKGKNGNETLEYVKIFDILQSQERERKRKMVFIGEAGVGKSTLLESIAFDWATNKCLREIELLFLVKFREIDNKPSSFGDIGNELVDESDMLEISGDVVNTYIQRNQSKTMILLDGYDEYSGDIHKDRDDVLGKIMRGERYKDTPLIVTMRPWRADQITIVDSINKQYQRVKVEGFKPKDAKVYVNKFFHEDEESANGLVDLIKTNGIVGNHMAPYPIFCAMLCQMWKDESRRNVVQKLEKYSQLLEVMVQSLTEQLFAKDERSGTATPLDEFQNTCNNCFIQIGQIAFGGLVKNRLVLTEDMLKGCIHAVQIACNVGVLTRTKKLAPREMRKKGKQHITDVQFPHKLLQEYLAGWYVASLHQSNPEEFQQVLYRITSAFKSFRYLLYFVALRGGAAGLALMEDLCKRNYDQDFIVDVALECYDKEAIVPVVAYMQETTVLHLKQIGHHTLRGYLHIWDQRFSAIEEIRLEDMAPDPMASRHLAKAVSYMPKLRLLSMENMELDVAFYATLCNLASSSKIEELQLGFITLDHESSKHMAKAISSMPKLQSLVIRYMALEDAFFATLCGTSSSSKIEKIEFGYMLLQTEASKHIAGTVSSMPKLRSLVLSAMGLDDAFYATLCNSLSSSNKIEEITIDSMDLNPVKSKHMAGAISSMPKLRTLSMEHMNLDHAFYATLCDSSSSSKIEEIKLKSVRFDTVSMASAISSMPNLRSLELNNIRLDDAFYANLRDSSSSAKSHPSPSYVVELHMDIKDITTLPELGIGVFFPRVEILRLTIVHFDANLTSDFITPMAEKCSWFTRLKELHLRGIWTCLKSRDTASLCDALLNSCSGLTELSITNINVGNQVASELIHAMEAHSSLESISFKSCTTDPAEDIDTLCDEVNQRGKLDVGIEHGMVSNSP